MFGKEVTVFMPSTPCAEFSDSKGPSTPSYIACVEFSDSKEAQILCLVRKEMFIKKIKVKIEAAPKWLEAGGSRDFERGSYPSGGYSSGGGNMEERYQIEGFGRICLEWKTQNKHIISTSILYDLALGISGDVSWTLN